MFVSLVLYLNFSLTSGLQTQIDSPIELLESAYSGVFSYLFAFFSAFHHVQWDREMRAWTLKVLKLEPW